MDLWNPDYTKTMQVKPIFKERSFSVKKRLIGVLIPFQDPFEALYQDHIKPFLENLDFEVQSADNRIEKWYDKETLSSASPTEVPSSALLSSAAISSTDWRKIIPSSAESIVPHRRHVQDRPIIEDIWILLNQSHFLIADLTWKNPNVFYELGIAHTIGKYVIIISQSELDVPFDIGHLRYIFYEYNKDGIEGLLEKIKGRIENIVREETY
jgi:hypothetical protein